AQRQALAFLCAQAGAELPIDSARELAAIFHAKPQPESISPLRRLLDHPSLAVARDSAEALEFMGEKAEIPPKLGPVRYRLLVDGKPYAGRKVEWIVKWGNLSTSSEVLTDAGGVAAVPRDMFLDQGRGPVQLVALRSAAMSRPDDPWFSARMPAPPASEDVIPVEVKTQPRRVELSLPRPETELRGKTMDVALWGEQGDQGGFWAPARLKLPAARELTFEKLMPGTYRVEIRVPGAASWAGELRAGDPAALKVPLVRASDVKPAVRPPPHWEGLLIPELLKDGKVVSTDWDYENFRLRGVPVGHYVLRVPSSAEIRKRTMALLPDGPEFDAVEVPFEVAPDSPVEIDLGEIKPKVR
ncbi:MAG TPA: hypothetical protein VIS74_03765, partial [Chthoniobacterales bacterium]